ncbi:MAG: penicillin acylase family protein [Chloroflexi bacterium]|nr:penicillin acylase family protein [Chloroflexota bacterium]
MRKNKCQLDGKIAISGIHAPIEILRDRWGVPHIYAQTERDLFFAQGFTHAQDRLFQMDLNRRIGAGRLSELVGPPGISTDRIARTLGWPRVIQAQLDGGDDGAYAVAEAYTAGVNAFIAQGRFPIEYKLLATKPAPWQMQDSAAWGTVLAWGLAVNWESELMRATLIAELGAEKAADLTPMVDPAAPAILPNKLIEAQLATAVTDALQAALNHVPLSRLPIGQGVGSNNWVVNGSRSETKRPFLANDPHLPPVFPTIWYENHLVGDGYNVTGFSTPGVPGVLIGHNEKVAWGITNAFPDVQDLFVEQIHPDDPSLYKFEGSWKKAERVIEPIFVRGRREPILEYVRYTHHGPIISDILPQQSDAISLQWASFTDNNHLRAIMEMNKAADWQQFCNGVQEWGFLPCQNVVYADVNDNIGYIMPGRVPIRKQGDGITPAPGWRGTHEWDGWIPFAQLPRAFNPEEGMIVTANNRVVGNAYPYLLTNEWLVPYRAARIRELISQKSKLNMADHQRIQNDIYSPMAHRFLHLALPALAQMVPDGSILAQAHQLLLAWNFEMDKEAAAPTLYYGWLVHFMRLAIEQAVDKPFAAQLFGDDALKNFSGNSFHKIAPELAMRWLETDAPDWVGDVRPLLLPTFQKTVDDLVKLLGVDINTWRWGAFHYVNLSNPLSKIPGIGRFWKPVKLPLGGDGSSINQAETPPDFPPEPVQMIPSCRMILDVGEWDNSVSALPGGQSGQRSSLHYQDGIEGWANGRYHPMLFSREQIETAATHHITLHPVQ